MSNNALVCVLSLLIASLAWAQPAPPPIIPQPSCATWTNATRLCEQTNDNPDTLWWYDGATVVQIGTGVIPADDQTLEEAKTQGRFITSASAAAPVTICNSGGANCTGSPRIDLWVTAGNVPTIRIFDASGNPLSEELPIFDGTTRLFTIGNGVGVQQPCVTVGNDGIFTYASGTESCGQLASVTRITSSAGDPADTGVVRLGNAEELCWESSPAGTDNCLSVNTSEQLTYGGIPVRSYQTLCWQGNDPTGTPAYMIGACSNNHTTNMPTTDTANVNGSTRIPITGPGTVQSFCCQASAVTTATYPCTLRINGANSTATLTLTAADTTVCDTTNHPTLGTNDFLSVEVTDTGASEDSGDSLKCWTQVSIP